MCIRDSDQTQLYLLCYAWVRYRQLSDNLVDAMAYHMKQLEDESLSLIHISEPTRH
ncbi:hypothetical protein [Klebsiella pneumoniae]|uniref:Uncharacterized protein n=1 Tax=Klebsiella pneumoniae subsp. pneumoniae TaxID=72407 RepID=A0ACC7QMY9_KLEPN